MLYDVVLVDDKGDAIGDARRRPHAEAVDEIAPYVGELPDRQPVEILMGASPREFDELIVGRTAKNDRVPVGEFLR